MPTKTAILISALLLALNLSANARTALVIGNGAYTKLSALANPGNDARDMASSLTALGFDAVFVGETPMRAPPAKYNLARP